MTPLLTFAIACSIPFSSAAISGHEAQHVMQSPLMTAKRVAVIGAGAGGSSAAYYLRQNAEELGIETNITVFERSPYIGGRSTTVFAWDDPSQSIELGASIFVQVNKILVSAVEKFGLKVASHDRPKPENAPELGIWNGHEFILQVTAGSTWWDTAKLLWRYGLAPVRTQRLMKATVGKFLKMYDEPYFPFESLTKAVLDLELTGTTAATGEQFLKENSIGDAFANEVIQASTRVNYAQNLPLIHGLETMVCMAAEGAMAVEGGNWRIFSNMVESAKADLHLNTSVTSISRQPDGTYTLTAETAKGAGETSQEQTERSGTFDTVILAAPYQFADITVSPALNTSPDKIPYVQLHVTLFATPHKLSPGAFNMPSDSLVPQFVLTTLPPDEHYGSSPDGVGSAGFFSISIVGGGINPHSSTSEYIYKIFSPKPINSTFLSKVLGVSDSSPDQDELPLDDVSWIYRKVWNSYPYEYPRVTFEEIKLDDGLFYTSGIESFISTMETSALMGRNVARLVTDEWLQEKGVNGLLTNQSKVKEGIESDGVKDKPLKAKL